MIQTIAYKEKTMTITYSKSIPRIGQGGLIIQTVSIDDRKVQIIFDCGTSSSKSNIQKEIRRINKNIDTYLIISHFHNDHVNCVDLIKHEKIRIRKVFIPKCDRLESALLASTTDNPVIAGFILSPGGFFEGAELITVDSDTGEQLDVIDESSSGESALINHTSTPRFAFPNESNFFWFIKFFVNKFALSGISPANKRFIASIKDIDDLLVNRTKLYSIYRDASPSNFNHTSMMAFTYLGFMEKGASIPIDFYPNRNSLIMCTGDIKISTQLISDAIQDHYNEQLCLISDVMLPHHGSDNYFNFIPFPHMIRAYAQTGPYRKYGHPGAVTQTLVEDFGAEFYNITSDGFY